VEIGTRWSKCTGACNLDEWMKFYNNERVHSGRYCYGKTPMATFKESIILAQQKFIGHFTPAA